MPLEIDIKVVNVEDGDAVIIYLHEDRRKFVILVDGGELKFFNAVLTELEATLKVADKLVPDLVVCTHFDSDHIRGANAIITHYFEQGHKVGEVWIHAPSRSLINEAHELHQAFQQRTRRRTRLIPIRTFFHLENFETELMPLLESFDEMGNLVHFLNKNLFKWEAPFPDVSIDLFPEIEVLGPNKEYFARRDPFKSKLKKLLQEVYSGQELLLINEQQTVAVQQPKTICELLDLKKKIISKVNLTSLVFSIAIEDKKFLFTSDAGVESFSHIDHEKLQDIFWLKVPHHGSSRNLNSELIKLMSPKYSFISGKDQITDEIVGCLRAHCSEVYTTRDDGTLTWPFS